VFHVSIWGAKLIFPAHTDYIYKI